MKKNEYFIMVAMFVLTIVIVSSIIVLFTKNLSDESKKIDAKKQENVQEEKKKTLALIQPEQEKLLQQIAIYDPYFISFDGTKKINALTDVEKITFIMLLPIDSRKQWNLDFDAGVPLTQVMQVLQFYFGPDISFTPVNYPCFLGDGDYLIYDENTKTYKTDSTMHGHGGFYPYQVMNYYVDGYKETDETSITYTIKVKKFFTDAHGSDYYGSYSDATNKQNLIIDLFALYGEKAYTDTSKLLQIQYEKNKGLLPVYTYTFKTNRTVEEVYLVDLVK